MAEYFTYLPDVKHSDVMIKNITLRTKIHDYIRGNPKVFLPYTVEDSMRPEDVALHYYGSTRYTWLVYLSASVIDPYHDWPISDNDLTKYIIRKYKSCALKYYQANGEATMIEPTDNQVLAFTKNTTITDNLVEYRRYDDENVTISVDSYSVIPFFLTGQGLPIDTIRTDGTPLKNGDLYLNIDTQSYYVWNGFEWVSNLIQYFNHQMIQGDWYPIRYYDWEVEKNENRRQIELVDRIYLGQIMNEFITKIGET